MDSRWISWPGGNRPVAENVQVRVRFRDGGESGKPMPAFFWDKLWRHDGMHHSNDVVAYCIVEAA